MRGMRPEDVDGLSGVADPRLSPDGRTAAYVVQSIDREAKEPRSAIWTVAMDGSSEPRRVTFGPTRDASPRWSPDGRWLAFTSARDGETAQLYVLRADGPGEARRLTGLKEDVEEPGWAPDSRSIAFTARDHDPDDDEDDLRRRRPRRITRLQYRLDHEGWTAARTRSVWVVGLDDAAPRQLTTGEFEDSSPAWSPDGGRIVFSSARHEDWDLTTATDLYVVDSAGGAPRLLTFTDGACETPSWSPDGRSIAYAFVPGLFDEPRHGRIAVLDVETGARAILTADLDRNAAPFPPVREPIWHGTDVVFALEDRGHVHLYRVPGDGSGPPVPIVEPDGWITGFDLVEGTLVHTMTTPTSFPELYAGTRRLTDAGATFFADVAVAVPEPFTATASDGTEVDAWVIRPVGFEQGVRYPTVLNIHGGPFTQYGPRFFDEFQIQAGAGFVVLFANPRGSSGYGESWGRAIRGPAAGGPGWGSVDLDDLMAVVDEAVRRFDFIDPDRLGVMGGSYGGYMTSWIVSHTDRFTCAISERAVNDLASEDGESDFAGFFRGYLGAHPWEDPEAFRRVSPLAHAEAITTPLLIMHSEEDLRCPIGQGEMLFAMLRTLRREVEFVRFPGECHELTRSGSPVHRVQRFEIVLEWLRRYLASEG